MNTLEQQQQADAITQLLMTMSNGGYGVNPDIHAPPNDKPWLISSALELQRDASTVRSYSAKWLATAPFPGRDANRDSKILWLRNIGQAYDDDLQEAFYMLNAPEPVDVAAAELLHHAPEKIMLEVHCVASNLDQLTDVNEVSFPQGLALYGRKDYKGEANFEAYHTWLAKQAESDTHVLLGSMECCKTDDIGANLKQMVRALGFELSFMHHQELPNTVYWWDVNPKVGENLYYPTAAASAAGGDDNATAAVQIAALFRKPTANSKASAAFVNDLLSLKSQVTGSPKSYLLVEKPLEKAADAATDGSDNDDEDDDDEKMNTAETCLVLWLPEDEFDMERQRMVGHFEEGDGESLEIKQRLRKGNTDSGNLMLAIFEAEFAHIQSYRGWTKRFCSTLALTSAATRSVDQMCDNEDPRALASLMRELSSLWRTKLLKRTDGELGIGLPNEPVDENGMSDSRKALYRLLEMYAMRVDDVPNEGGRIELNWMPKTRKRKDSPKAVAETGSFDMVNKE